MELIRGGCGFPIANPARPGAEVYVDFVRFEDGATWGPNDAHYAQWVEGYLKGHQMAKARFWLMPRRDGVDALVAELERTE